MESLVSLIPGSIVLVFGVIAVIFLVVRQKSGQFDDLEGPGYRVVSDDDAHDHADARAKRPTRDVARALTGARLDFGICQQAGALAATGGVSVSDA